MIQEMQQGMALRSEDNPIRTSQRWGTLPMLRKIRKADRRLELFAPKNYGQVAEIILIAVSFM